MSSSKHKNSPKQSTWLLEEVNRKSPLKEVSIKSSTPSPSAVFKMEDMPDGTIDEKYIPLKTTMDTLSTALTDLKGEVENNKTEIIRKMEDEAGKLKKQNGTEPDIEPILNYMKTLKSTTKDTSEKIEELVKTLDKTKAFCLKSKKEYKELSKIISQKTCQPHVKAWLKNHPNYDTEGSVCPSYLQRVTRRIGRMFRFRGGKTRRRYRK